MFRPSSSAAGLRETESASPPETAPAARLPDAAPEWIHRLPPADGRSAASPPRRQSTPRALRTPAPPRLPAETLSYAAQDLLKTKVHVFQVIRVAARKLHRGRTFVLNFAQGIMHGTPVDLPFPQVHPTGDAVLKLEVLDVELHDPLAQHPYPILRITVDGHVADVEIGAAPRALERIDIAREHER